MKQNKEVKKIENNCEQCLLKNKDEFDLCFKYYEKAIEGRNFHYSNYNAWVNLYSIFTGAIFIAYYTTMNNFNCSSCLQIILTVLGIITSYCWLSQIRGYYYWMLSWIKIVHSYEYRLSKIIEKNKNIHLEKYYVYSVLDDSTMENEIFAKNLSTQKITVVFVWCLIAGWTLILVYNLIKKYEMYFYLHNCKTEIITGVILYGLSIIFPIFIISTLHSSTDGMFKDIRGKNKWCDENK